MKTKLILHFMLSVVTMLSLTQCVTVDESGYYPGSYPSGRYGYGQGGYGYGSGQGGYGYGGSRYGGRYDYDHDDHDAENYYPQGTRGGGSPMSYPPYRSGY